jgi:hypothetical protein
MELDVFGDVKKSCFVCKRGADLKEGTKLYCCNCYSKSIWGKTIDEIELIIKKESGKGAATK